MIEEWAVGFRILYFGIRGGNTVREKEKGLLRSFSGGTYKSKKQLDISREVRMTTSKSFGYYRFR